MKRTLYIFFTFLFLFTSPVFPQVITTALPFLLIGASPTTNGMGELSSVESNDPMLGIANPGHIGLQSLTTYASANLYENKTQWLPIFGLSDLYYQANAGMLGVHSGDFIPTAPNIGLGFAYSKVLMNLGEFIQTNETGQEVGSWQAYEYSENHTYSIGVDYFVRLGLGYTSKRIISHLAPVGTDSAGKATINDKFSAHDIGAVLTVPVLDIISQTMSTPLKFVSLFLPTFDITTSYSLNNIGGNVTYMDGSQSDPFPRTVNAGYSLRAGVVLEMRNQTFEIASVMLGREAQDYLVRWTSNGTWEYLPASLHDINIMDNLIKGKENSNVLLRKGWSWSLFDIATFRYGSNREIGRAFNTRGYSLRFTTVFRLLDIFFSNQDAETPIGFIAKHLDAQYNYAEYEGLDGSPINGTTFTSISISLK